MYTLAVAAVLLIASRPVIVADCSGGSGPRVALGTGCVEGLWVTSVLGRPYNSFRGIPYAAPPVGDLRFRAPRLPAIWSGVLYAVEDPPACIQERTYNGFPITYSEDCLYLNVYTPYLQHPSGRPMPVIVWVHGGKFTTNSVSSGKYGPDFQMMKDVVVVVFNYRLGVFGYLNMNVPEAQGNASLKDKIAVLRWVKQEIAKFGGDPNMVTLAGSSSGAAEASLLYISPATKGLFSRVICQSGSSLNNWAFTLCSMDSALTLAQYAGCPTHSAHAVVACFKSLDAAILGDLLSGIQGDGPILFLPSLEYELGEEVVLPDIPERLMAQAGGVPLLTGINSLEGIISLGDDPFNENKNYTDLVKMLLPKQLIHENPKVYQNTLSRVAKFCFEDCQSISDTVHARASCASHVTYCDGVLKAAQDLSTRATVYLYYFTFQGEFTDRRQFHPQSMNISGVAHGEEMGYVFYRNYTVQAHNHLSDYPKEMAVVDNMMTLWTNFARYGDPTPQLNEEMSVRWEPVVGGYTQHLAIADSLEMIHRPLLKDKLQFWDDIYACGGQADSACAPGE